VRTRADDVFMDWTVQGLLIGKGTGQMDGVSVSELVNYDGTI